MRTILIITLTVVAQISFAQVKNSDTIFLTSIFKVKNPGIRKELRAIALEAEMENKKLSLKLSALKKRLISKRRIELLADSFAVHITASPFKKQNHKLTYTYYDSAKYLAKIDGKNFYGTDGGPPQTEISAVYFVVNKDTIFPPRKFYDDLYQPNMFLSNSKTEIQFVYGYKSRNKKFIYIGMLNSDGAGSYEVIWVIENKKIIYRIAGHLC
jgi:hypothetical protein